MASAPLGDIDEQHLRCSICSKQLQEPKLLPCLHRYCKDCLKETVDDQDKAIKCPTCRENHELPEGGVDALKTDFNTKNIIEFIQLQESVKQEPSRVCVHCSKELKAAAFCFRCDDFLCQDCHEHHMTNKIVRDHRPHIFSFSEDDARNLTIERLSSLREAPKCQAHPENHSELCCATCGNLPVCVPCSYGAHRGHDLQEVTSLAKVERARLTEKLDDLMQHEEKLHQRREVIANASGKLSTIVNEKRTNLQHESEELKTKISKTEEEKEKKKNELEEKSQKKASLRKQELEDQMKEVQAKYDQACEDDRKEAAEELHRLQEECEQEKTRLEEMLNILNREIEDLLTSLESQEEENAKKIEELSERFDYITERLENVTKTARGILAAKNDWTDVLSVPDICLAIESLITDMKNASSESDALPDVTPGGLASSNFIKEVSVDISEKEESIIDITGIGEGFWVSGITSNYDGSITVTGTTPDDNKSHITVLNMKGEKMQQQILSSNQDSQHRYCDFLSRLTIATVCGYDEIGLYDIREEAYRKISIKDSISNWPEGRRLRSVAADPVNNHIIVGQDDESCKDVYVFDGQLQYVCTMKLPERIAWPRDMRVNKGNLLVCDFEGANAYVIVMEELECKILRVFPKPDVDGDGWKPHSFSVDKNRFIYILWETGHIQKRSILVQYNQDGSQVLTVRRVNEDHFGAYIAAVETDQGEKILIPALTTGKIVTYGLVKDTL